MGESRYNELKKGGGEGVVVVQIRAQRVEREGSMLSSVFQEPARR